jgi:DNA modification methylase
MAVRIINADVMDGLAQIEDESVHCCVTSPPYWGLRDYGADGQIGLEKTPEEFVAKLVAVFREVRRVLRKDGTLWLNLGDSYAGGGGGPKPSNIGGSTGKKIAYSPSCPITAGLKPKDLVGIPWRVAFALQADGWYLRQELIWAKPNPMPESVKDRCTKAHEHIFLLTKSERYWFDAAAISETMLEASVERQSRPWNGNTQRGMPATSSPHSMSQFGKPSDGKRNKRSVWTIATQPYSEAHFATFPEELPETCIKAGCPVGGTVLDPFGGAGTTGLVADKLGRNAILIELNPDYAAMAEKRIFNSCPLFTDVEAQRDGDRTKSPQESPMLNQISFFGDV